RQQHHTRPRRVGSAHQFASASRRPFHRRQTLRRQNRSQSNQHHLRAPRRTQVRPRHAHQHLHRLPRPSRHKRPQFLPRLHVVGQRVRRPVHVPQKAALPHPRRRIQSTAPQPRRLRRPWTLVRSQVPREHRHARI